MTIYEPLRLENQIEDAIEGYKPPELEERIEYIKAHIDQVKIINGDVAYSPEIKGKYIHYSRMHEGQPQREYYPVQYAYIYIMDGTQPRKLSNQELADLPEAWENPTADIRLYYPCALEAWEVDREFYERYKAGGGLCQEYQGKYYVGNGA